MHVHGVPELILSDRDKEFLGVATSVCRCLSILHTKTTPYHPRTNGLCESQHKTLTLELKIRSARPSAPQWSSLLTEISFASNIIPSRTTDALSPFNLVFCRKPRLSPQDVCFPVRAHPRPVNQPDHRVKFEAHQRKELQGLRFKAIEATIAAKETMREQYCQYDKSRADTIKTKGLRPLAIGDIVCICQPQPKLLKLTFQWSEPVFVVTSTSPTNITVRDLSRNKGGKDISSCEPSAKEDMVVNRKMTSLYPVPISFFTGALVRKKFGGRWCSGTVDWVDTDEGETLWHVMYDDFDEEQLTRSELGQVVVYHPLLDCTGDLEVPSPGSFVWYAVNQQPRLGQVVSIDSTVPRPIVVEVYVPQANAPSLAKARSVDPNSSAPHVDQITLHQVRLHLDHLTPKGYLTHQDRKRLLET